MSEANVVTPPDSFTVAILEAALAERDARIKEFEATIIEQDEKLSCKSSMVFQLRGEKLKLEATITALEAELSTYRERCETCECYGDSEECVAIKALEHRR